MKLAPLVRLLTLLAFLCPLGTFAQVQVEPPYGLGVTTSATTPSPGDLFFYTISVTNRGSLSSTAHVVTYYSPAALNFQNFSNFPSDPVNNPVTKDETAGIIDFQISQFSPGSSLTFRVNFLVSSLSSFTTTISATNRQTTLFTNVVITTSVTNSTDLGISISQVPSAILVNDQVTYTLTATNIGPSSASRVVVNNAIPSGSILVSSSAPSDVSQSGGNITWQLGTLNNAASQALTLTIQPTNIADSAILANISAPLSSDPTTLNNAIAKNISIQPIVTSNLSLTRGAQTFNRNTGLFEETETVKNVGTITIPTTRIFVTNIASADFLYNVGGTNGTTPYVLYTNALAPGDTASIPVQFYFHDRKFNTSQGLTAVQGPLASFSSTLALSSVSLTNNFFSFEFPASSTRVYSIQRSDSVLFTNAQTLVLSNAVASNKIAFSNLVDSTTNQFFRAILNP